MPAGAVATGLIMMPRASPGNGVSQRQYAAGGADSERDSEEATAAAAEARAAAAAAAAHQRNPYQLDAEEGAVVDVCYPFKGDAELEQLTFAVGDKVRLVRKEEQWSWGRLERTGAEGWFPHSYVQVSGAFRLRVASLFLQCLFLS
ncbi:unnamed protein product [Phaeothamnion confervicola]